MAFRTVVISNRTELHVQSGQLVAVQEQTTWIPIEDIAVLILEHPRVRASAAALSLLVQQGVAVAVCDEKHMPTGLLVSHCAHSRQLAVTRQQLSQTLPHKKRVWQRLIQSKIRNQSICLETLGLPGSARLLEYADSVQSGDTTGMEAAAARLYFRRLIPTATRRSQDGPGGSLDYGYAVLRAAVARSLVGHGFYPAIGLHHDSQLNSFNLADDILEPYRPFVDYLAIANDVDVEAQSGRRLLLSVLQTPCGIQSKLHSVLTGIEATVSSLSRSMAERDSAVLALPSFVAPSTIPEALAE